MLLKSTGFAHGKGIDIHIRTKIQTWWSFIERAVIRIGGDTLEVKGGEHSAESSASYWVNGELGQLPAETTGYTELGETISDYKIEFKNVSARQKNFRVKLGNGDSISIQTFRDFIRVDVKRNGTSNSFDGSVGLMGQYPSGSKVDREGKLVDDTDEFGKEWQVRRTEPQLFHTLEGVQDPEECQMPLAAKAASKGRRLGEVLISKDEADIACARVGIEEKANCIFDVLAVNSKSMADSY